MRLGKKVLDLLDERGRTRAELARALGCKKNTTVEGWKEENRNPSSEYVIPICRFFGITPNELFDWDEASGAEQPSALSEPLDERVYNLLEHYQALDMDGKARVEALAANEHDRVKIEGDKAETIA